MSKRKVPDDDGDAVDAATVRQQRAAFLASMSRGISPPPSSRTPDSAASAATTPVVHSTVSEEAKKAMDGPQHAHAPRLVPSPFKLTKIRDLPASSNIDTVSLHDILGNPLIKEAWVFNFCFDIDWMMQYFDPDVRQIVQVKIVHGSWKAEDRNKMAIDDACRRWANVEAATAYLPDPFGTHHSKMFVLFTHDDCAEVIIHTANMLAKDWTNMTQAVWRSGPLPHAESNDGELAVIGAGKRFKYDLLEYFRAYKRPTKDLVQQLRQYDFDMVKGALVGSVPTKIDNKQARSTASQHLWGYPQVREVMKQRALSNTHPQSTQPHLVAQVSSIATLHNGWLETLVGAFQGSVSSTRSAATLSIIYPTASNVAASLDGYAAGGSIHTKAQSAAHLKQIDSLRPHLHQWTRGGIDSYRSDHDLAAPHIKTYIQFMSKPTNEKLEAGEVDIGWVLVTSANLSTQAWGSLPRTDSKEKAKTKTQATGEGTVHIQSFEIGVLIWPELFIAPNQPLARARMVPVSGQDMPHAIHRANDEEEEIVVGIRMPYDLPLTPYGPGELPWSPQGTYQTPDSKGRVWG